MPHLCRILIPHSNVKFKCERSECTFKCQQACLLLWRVFQVTFNRSKQDRSRHESCLLLSRVFQVSFRCHIANTRYIQMAFARCLGSSARLLVFALSRLFTTHSYVRHDSPLCETWLTRMWDMTDSYVRHDSLVCETWLTRMCGMTHLFVRHNPGHMYEYYNTPHGRIVL